MSILYFYFNYINISLSFISVLDTCISKTKQGMCVCMCACTCVTDCFRHVATDIVYMYGACALLQFLPIPELMPFRLTPQIVNLLLPHKESGKLCSCMIHTMRALQNKPTMLLNTMDVFIKEPSLEWKVYIHTHVHLRLINVFK